MSNILITPRSLTKNGHPSLKRLEEAGFGIIFSTPGVQPSEEELIERLPGCVGYLAGVEKISKEVLQSAGKLKVISRNGVGVNNIDAQAARALQIRICNTPGANARGVAELTFAHILTAVRSITFCDASLKSLNWQRRKGVELKDKILGLVGCGCIGKTVARFALGFDMKVVAYDPCRDEEYESLDNFSYCDYNDLVIQSDIISLHCPPAAGGKAIIDGKAISQMKTGVYIINTARAELLDDEAVLTALDNGTVAGLTLDVFSPEPPENWTLIKHPKVIATSHIGGFTNESVNMAVDGAVENLLSALQQV